MPEKIINRDGEVYLLYKKGSFDALKDGITRLPEPPLRRMAALWLGSQEGMILPLEELVPELREAMSDLVKLRAVLDRLPKRCFDLLFYIFSEGGWQTYEDLSTGFPLRDKETLRQILRPLAECGLVWELRRDAQDEDEARFHTLALCESYLHLPSFLDGKLGAILPHKSKDQINTLVTTLGGDPKQLAKNRETLPWLKGQLRNPVRLRRLFESFDINERKLLKILALHTEGLPLSKLKYQFTLFSNKDPEAILPRALEHLEQELGLVYTRPSGNESRSKREKEPLYGLPREISALICQNFKSKYKDEFPAMAIFQPPDEDFALGSRSKERSALWIDFQQLLNHLIRCEVGVIRKGGMHKKNLKRILDRLEARPVDAYHYLDFLFLYAYEREILHPISDRWIVHVKNLLALQNEAAFCRDFWAFYRHNASWNDRDSSPLQGVLQKGDSVQVLSLRRAVLRSLWDCPVGQWIEMKIFFDHLCDREEGFRSGELPVITGDPVKERYRFMKSTLERSLTWLGVVDTTSIAARRLDLFRLTEIGAWLLRGKPEQTPLPSRVENQTLYVQSNMEIAVPANFPLEKQLYLARFTDDHKGRIMITRASVRRGLEDNLSVREMRGFLREHNAEGDIPPNIEHLMNEVVEKTGNIFIGGEPFRLEVSDQMLLDELLLQKRFLPFIQERADGKKALLRRGTDLEKLMDELRSAGYSPRPL